MEIFLEETLDIENISTGEVEPGSWRSNGQLVQIQPYQGRNSSSTAKEVRDNFCSYFNNAGAVHWQDNLFENNINL